jgi:hypothetical protein
VSVVALSLSVVKPRVGGAFALLSLAIALAPGGIGVLGTYLGHSRVDDVVASGAIDPAMKERIRQAGYAEAATCTTVGVGAMLPPLVLSGIALVIALARRKRTD